MRLFRSGIVVAFFTFVSRLFGLVRELFIAAVFGAGDMADTVNVASKLPSLFRRITAEGALSTVFVPIFNEKMLSSKEEALKVTGEIFTLLVTILVILTALMQLFMPPLMYIIAPGFAENADKFEVTVLYCRITMPYVIFVSVSALFGGILNSVGRFAAFAFCPVILSVGVVLFTWLFRDSFGAGLALSISIIVAGLMQVLFMTYCLYRAGLLFPLVFSWKDKDVGRFLVNMVPAAISSGVQQLNLFISQSIASFVTGAVSILSYADRIYQFPLSIIGITFGTILLPELSRMYKSNNSKEAALIQNKAIKAGMFLALPAAFGIILLAEPIIHVIYERGAFTRADTIKTAGAISAFALGLPAFILSKILTPIFYAHNDTKTPMKLTIYSLSVNTVLNIILMFPFGPIGIALGSSIAAWYNVYLLKVYTSRQHQFRLPLSVVTFCFKVCLSCAFMALIILGIRYNFESCFYAPSTLYKVSVLLGVITLGAGGYFAAIIILRLHKEI